ncbi:hypothetical protein THERMOT_89 [Bathymodiolus thermophilus thioautotrophic gill symbiont]|nr:hypothetical protein THERMOT_89 [Bathymodiolus thermophilus thioautotrophic gill symbiont]
MLNLVIFSNLVLASAKAGFIPLEGSRCRWKNYQVSESGLLMIAHIYTKILK